MKKFVGILVVAILLLSALQAGALTPNTETNGTIVSLPIIDKSKTSKDVLSLSTSDIADSNIYMRYSIVNGYSMSGIILTIDQNGKATLETISKTSKSKPKIKTIQLTKNEFINLKSIVNNAKLFSLNDSYRCEKLCPTDLSTTTVEFHYYDKVKRISLYAPKNTPKELIKVINALKSVQNKASNAK